MKKLSRLIFIAHFITNYLTIREIFHGQKSNSETLIAIEGIYELLIDKLYFHMDRKLEIEELRKLVSENLNELQNVDCFELGTNGDYWLSWFKIVREMIVCVDRNRIFVIKTSTSDRKWVKIM